MSLDLTSLTAHPLRQDPYRSQAYAFCHQDQGTPFYLEPWDTWILRRPIPGSTREDATGFYPACRLGPRPSLEAGLTLLKKEGLVSFTLVTDLFGDPQVLLDLASFHRPFKTHYLVDLTLLHYSAFSRHHRYEIRKSPCQGALLSFPDYLGEWMDLYSHLHDRHHIDPERRLSSLYFEKLTEVPQIVAMGAFLEKKLVSMHLWIHDGTYVFSHLAASHPHGYDTGAAYVVNKTSIDYFGSHPEFSFKAMDLGGCSGAQESPDQGLSRFKKGFSNGEKPVFLCGYILDPEAYLSLSPHPQQASYFPAYRGEGR